MLLGFATINYWADDVEDLADLGRAADQVEMCA